MLKIDCRRIINCRIITVLLVICTVILSGYIPQESILHTTNSVTEHGNSLNLNISKECLAQINDAIVPSVSIHDYSSNEYRILGKKSNGNISRQLRIIHLFFALMYSVLSMPLLCSFYINFIGEREQKLLIIEYIHNKDGLKSIAIT